MPQENRIPEEDEEMQEEAEMPEVPDLPVPPDGGWGWIIVLASFFTNLLVDGVCYSFGILYLSLLEEFQESKAKTAWVGSLLPGCYLIIGPITSALVNKFGCRRVTMTGGVIASTFFVISAFAPSIDVLIFTYGIMGGIGFGLMYLPGIVIVAQYFSTKRSMATGLAVCGSGIGTFIFGPLTTILIREFGWRGSLLIIGGLVLNGVVFGALFRPLVVERRKKKKQKEPTKPEEVKRGIIMQKLIEQKKRDRTISTKSLDGAVITTDNMIVTGSDARMISLKSTIPEVELPSNGHVTSGTGSTPDLTETIDDLAAADIAASKESLSTSQPQLSTGKIPKNNGHIVNKQLDKVKFGGSMSKLRKRTQSMNEENEPLCDSGTIRARQSPEEIRKREAARPFNRQDIFYTGSVQSLAEYKKDPNMSNYLASIVSIPEPPLDEDSCEYKCMPFKRVLLQMFDVSMLKSVTFIIIAASGILSFTGFFTPFIYTTEYAVACGIPMSQAAFLISIIGICNTLGRVAAGWFADRPWADSLMIHNVSIIIAGIAICLEPLCTTFPLLIIFCVVFGTCVAAFIALRSIVLCELLGVEKLNNAFGLLILFQGIAALIGTPISGAIVDKTGSHTISFIVAGILVAVSGIMCFPLRRISAWERAKEAKQHAEYRGVPAVPEISMEDVNVNV